MPVSASIYCTYDADAEGDAAAVRVAERDADAVELLVTAGGDGGGGGGAPTVDVGVAAAVACGVLPLLPPSLLLQRLTGVDTCPTRPHVTADPLQYPCDVYEQAAAPGMATKMVSIIPSSS